MEILENTINIENENKRIGSNFLGILNDIKRRPVDAARELGISVEDINLIIEGKLDMKLLKSKTGKALFTQFERNALTDFSRFRKNQFQTP